jgi:hypothetical protein
MSIEERKKNAETVAWIQPVEIRVPENFGTQDRKHHDKDDRGDRKIYAHGKTGVS